MPILTFLEECSSTNDEIIPLFTLNNFKNTAVYTFNQTKGRGQYGNSWEAPPNLNLAFSFCLKAKDIILSQSLFNFHTATIFRDFLASLTSLEVKIKWPNDIIIKNKKVSGILIEKKKILETEIFIIGIGMNVLQENFENLPKAGSLFTQCKVKFDLYAIANELFVFLNENLTKNQNQKIILEKFNQNLFKKEEISVFERNGLRQNGIIKYAHEDGFLEIDLEKEGLKKFYYKEIELLY